MPPKSRSEVRSAPATYRTYAEGPVTLQSHILQQEALAPPANSAFLWILSALSISAKVIAARGYQHILPLSTVKRPGGTTAMGVMVLSGCRMRLRTVKVCFGVRITAS